MNAQAEFIPAADTGRTVAEFSQTAAALAELRTQYQGTQFAVTTPAGLRDARRAVATLRDLRTSLEKSRLEKVRPLIDEQRFINAEAKRITDALESLEKPIKLQVDAGDAHREAEKAAAEKAEAERVARNRANIDALRNMPLQMIGQDAPMIAETLSKLRFIPPSAMVEPDFIDEAEAAHAATLATLATLHVQALERAEHAAALAAQQTEFERLRQAEAERVRLANEAAAAERAEADRIAAAARAESDRLAAIERDRIAAEQAAEQARIDAERAAMVKANAEEAAESARSAKIEADRVAAANAEALRIEREKAHADRVAAWEAQIATATLTEAATAAADYLTEIGHREAPATRQLIAVLRREMDRCPAGDFIAALEAAEVAGVTA